MDSFEIKQNENVTTRNRLEMKNYNFHFHSTLVYTHYNGANYKFLMCVLTGSLVVASKRASTYNLLY